VAPRQGVLKNGTWGVAMRRITITPWGSRAQELSRFPLIRILMAHSLGLRSSGSIAPIVLTPPLACRSEDLSSLCFILSRPPRILHPGGALGVL